MSASEQDQGHDNETTTVATPQYEFLRGMSPNETSAVMSVLSATNNDLSAADRDESVLILLNDDERYKDYLSWRIEQDEPAKANFFKMLRPALHSVCQKMLDKGNIKGLDIILKNEGDEVMKALSALKDEREQKEKEQNKISSQYGDEYSSQDPAETAERQTKDKEEDDYTRSASKSVLKLSRQFVKYVEAEWKRFEAIQQFTDVVVTFEQDASDPRVTLSAGSSENLLNAEVMVLDILWNYPDLVQCSLPVTVKKFSLTDADRVSIYKKSLSVLVKCTEKMFQLRADSPSALEDGKKHLSILMKSRRCSSSSKNQKSYLLSRSVLVDRNTLKKKIGELKRIANSTKTSISFESLHDDKDRINICSDDKDTISDAVTRISTMFKLPASSIGPFVLSSDNASNAENSSDSDSDSPEESSEISDSDDASNQLSDADADSDVTMHSCVEAVQVDKPNDVDSDDLKSFPDNMTVLFLGETGAGKSTAINSLVNYLKYTDIEDAVNDPTVLIKSSFTLTKRDEKMTTIKIVTEPTFSCEDTHKSNEDTRIGASCTQDAKAYNFTWKIGSKKKTIKIIDTPGIGDVRGIEYDKKNFAKILDYIADYPELNAICILIQPDARRLTPAFKFCIDELLVHLHKTASKNIMFCFTGTRSTFYRPGETYPTLKEHLDRLQRTRDIEISLNAKSMFCFDNEGFRYICARKRNYPFTDEQRQQYAKSYKHSATETRRMFKQMKALPVHQVNDTLCLNNTRSLILALAVPLAEISKNLTLNTKLLEDKLAEVDKLKKDGGDLEDKLYTEQLIITANEVNYPKTVCTASSCVEYKKFHPSHPHMMTYYKTECHPHCYLTGVQAESLPNAILQGCWAMNHVEGYIRCRICGCSWETHMHIRYELKTKMEKMVDPDVQDALKNKDSGVSAAEIFIKKVNNKINELRKESRMIMEYSAAFSTFLNKNSIMPYNDSYRQYLDYLITQERAKAALSGDNSLVKSLEKDKETYQQQIRILNNSVAIGGAERDIYEINDMIEELRNSAHGSTLKEIQNLEILSVRQAQEHESINVPIQSNSLMGAVKDGITKTFNYFWGGNSKSKEPKSQNQKKNGGNKSKSELRSQNQKKNKKKSKKK